MANAYHLKRLAMLVSKLSGKYVPRDELLKYVQSQIMAAFPGSTGYSLRTLQRDFNTLRGAFGIDVRYRDGYGYYLTEGTQDTEGYKALLQNFELLTSIYSDSVMQKYVIPEHRRIASPAGLDEIFTALRESRHLSFEYTYFRHGFAVARKEVKPYCLKESQHRWYLVGKDLKDDVMKCFALDRMGSMETLVKKFTRDESCDVQALFNESYGIWNDFRDPVEEVILHYDALDGAFVKTLPLHNSQEILTDDSEQGLTIRLRLRITNDFVMELLSRSRSLEVIAPKHLRKRIFEVYKSALERNR